MMDLLRNRRSTLQDRVRGLQEEMERIRAERAGLAQRQSARQEADREAVQLGGIVDAVGLAGGMGSVGAEAAAQRRVEFERQAASQEADRQLREWLATDERMERAQDRDFDVGWKEWEVGEQERAKAEAARQAAALADPRSEESARVRQSVEFVLGSRIPDTLSAAQLEPYVKDLIMRQRDVARQQFEAQQAALDRALKREDRLAQQEFEREKWANQRSDSQVGVKPLTQSQATAAGFGRRLQQAEQIFSDLERSGYDRTSLGGALSAALPNLLKSGSAQAQEQAERNFINAILRKESGAAISESEFESAARQYFPRVGDSPEVVEQKRRNRAQALEMLKAEAGPAWEQIQLVSRRPEEEKGGSQRERVKPKVWRPE